eukprot:GABW01003005.1.p1 GENE.GABW01003005.1~~GABW01003005.1.p1  ORF type:complete len:67 (-),score=4.62 GABW01003005.1:27-227(-)
MARFAMLSHRHSLTHKTKLIHISAQRRSKVGLTKVHFRLQLYVFTELLTNLILGIYSLYIRRHCKA